jgi:DNA polymerase-4
MRSAGARGSTVSIKLRYSYFKTITRQHTLAAPTDERATIESTAAMLLDAAAGPGDMFRLLGIQCSKLVDEGGVQGALWAPLHREDADQ